MLNLEPMAAQAANQMTYPQDAKTSENTITKALAVLTEQGVYAFGLFLATRKRDIEQQPVLLIDQQIRGLLLESRLYTANAQDMATYFRGISEPQQGEDDIAALHRLLLTKQLMETTLTYARYHAKAMNHD